MVVGILLFYTELQPCLNSQEHLCFWNGVKLWIKVMHSATTRRKFLKFYLIPKRICLAVMEQSVFGGHKRDDNGSCNVIQRLSHRQCINQAAMSKWGLSVHIQTDAQRKTTSNTASKLRCQPRVPACQSWKGTPSRRAKSCHVTDEETEAREG